MTIAASTFRFNLTSLDYAALVDEARRYAAIQFPEWDFDSEVDVGRLALDIYLRAKVHDIELTNGWVQEAFLTTARLRQSVLAHAVAKGYAPRSATPGGGNLSLTVLPAAAPRTYQPYALQFSTRNANASDPVFFENSSSFTIPAGATALSISLLAGQLEIQRYVGTGLPDQSTTLLLTPVLDGSIALLDDLGTPWLQAVDFIDALGDDKIFVAQLQGDGHVKILFGDGSNGAPAPLNLGFTLSYRVGGGLVSNVIADTVKTVERVPAGLALTVLTNPLKFQNGQDEQSTDSIRNGALRQNRQRKLLGRLEEVKAYAEDFPGISRAYCTLFTSTIVLVGIIPEGGGAPSVTLKANLQVALNSLLVMGYTSQVDDANLVTLTGATAIHVDFTTNPGFDSTEIANLIVLDLATYLSPTAYKVVNFRPVFLRDFSQALTLNALRARVQAFVDTGAIADDFAITSPVADVPILQGAIFTSTGSDISATSRNTRVVTYTV